MSHRPPATGERPGLRTWVGVVAVLAGVLVGGLRGPFASATFVAPTALFWLVTVGAGACCVGAVWVVVVGWRDRQAEIGVLGGALVVQSLLGLVHGLTVPGVLYGPNAATAASAFIALPAALLAGLPVVVAGSSLGRELAHHWRTWTLGWMAATTVVSGFMLDRPDALPAPTMGGAVPILVSVASLAVTLVLSHRHLRLYWVGRRPASLVASIALASLGLSGLVWLGLEAFTAGWWVAHVLDMSGVLAASVALGLGYRANHSVAAMVAPVVTRDPLVALDLGLSPVVHRLVAALESKDAISRDHVVRVAEHAVRAGERAGIGGTRLRRLGLGALLHDIGKLDIPDEILTKPGRLTDEETICMRSHVLTGERLLRTEPELAPVAPLVRSHHERFDGGGYPDGRVGADLPLEVAIACDACDAMAHTRHYRHGMGPDRAAAVLREHAGSQWDPVAVDLVLAVAAVGAGPGVLDDVGRSDVSADEREIACGCVDALPESTRFGLLATTGQHAAAGAGPRA